MTWISRNWGTAVGLNGIVYGNGTFVAVGFDNAIVQSLTSDSNLAALSLSEGSLTPTFSPSVTAYSTSVANAVANITATPSSTDPAATIQVRVNGGSYSAVTSGTSSTGLPLVVGANSIAVTVTGQEGLTTKNYTLTVTRVGPPSVATLAATAVVFNAANLNGTVKPNGLTTTAHFEYGLTTAYGTSTANQNVGAGTSAVAVQVAIGNLAANTMYHFRAVAANRNGTVHGADYAFATLDNAVVGTWAERTVVRNLPTTAGKKVDVGTLTFTGCIGSIEAAVNATGSGWTVAKHYLIPIGSNVGNGSPPGTWLKVLPTHDTGPSGVNSVNNSDLDINVSGATAQLRRSSRENVERCRLLLSLERQDCHPLPCFVWSSVSRASPRVVWRN